MKIVCLSNIAVSCFIMISTSTIAHAIVEVVRFEIFKIKGNTRILQTENTTDVYSKSFISCADICLSDPQCCVASYSKRTSTCRFDTSERCCLDTERLEGWRFIQQKSYISAPMTCTGCVSFGCSLYYIFEDQQEWTQAKENCKLLGGKLAELETSEENEFIQHKLRTRNTGDEYWIGGYNFHNDYDMEWVGQPNQSMPFSDFEEGEPNGLTHESCIVL